MYNCIIILGPTACGKTGLSIKLAQKLKTEIISADSMQIYKLFDIGTAKVTCDEMQGVKHHMIDIVDHNDKFSVADYRNRALPIIDELIASHKVPIITGGTGLYINSLIEDNIYGNCPPNNEIRDKYSNLLIDKGNDYLYSVLDNIDHDTATKLHANDTKRIIRALEIYETTGKTKSQWEYENRQKGNVNNNLNPLIIGLNLSNREALYNRINDRVDSMFQLGLMNEVDDLINNKHITYDMQPMQSIGYKEFFDYYNGTIDKQQLVDLIKQNTRHYAKRQMTYFRKINVAKWYNTDTESADAIVDDIIRLYNS